MSPRGPQAQPSDPDLEGVLHESSCPACGYHVAVSLFDGGRRPLATLAWPGSAAEARAMPEFPLSFLRCVDCGHVYNSAFDYSAVPYRDNPNLMFNKGTLWTDHLKRVQALILQRLSERGTVVEIGCGDGSLLSSLAPARPNGRFVGFDPNAATEAAPFSDVGGPVELQRRLFQPHRHLAEYRPELIISRHVLEHLMNPLRFVQSLSFAASWANVDTRLLIEVPCIEKALSLGRTVDFYYEHNSHFTTNSLARLLERCAAEVELVQRGYRDEVVYALARFARQPEQVEFARGALAFRSRSAAAQENVRRQLSALIDSGKTVAIWGGTGKGAALIAQYGLDAERFPVVVDSDPQKVGTFVPGSGQEIRFRDYLLDHPVDVILIATQWRAADIHLEIQQAGIRFDGILIEHEGRLVDYLRQQHPYRAGMNHDR